MSREAMKLALVALEGNCTNPVADPEQAANEDAAITALRQALETEKQWVGLTDEEIHQAFCHVEYETPNDWNKDPESWCIANAKYLQAILKGKNG